MACGQGKKRNLQRQQPQRDHPTGTHLLRIFVAATSRLYTLRLSKSSGRAVEMMPVTLSITKLRASLPTMIAKVSGSSLGSCNRCCANAQNTVEDVWRSRSRHKHGHTAHVAAATHENGDHADLDAREVLGDVECLGRGGEDGRLVHADVEDGEVHERRAVGVTCSRRRSIAHHNRSQASAWCATITRQNAAAATRRLAAPAQ